jgi:hypothetical protein
MLAAPAALAAPGNSGAAKACQNGGFARFQGTDGSRFADEGDCVSYAARGSMLAPVPTLTFVADPTSGYCDVILTLSGAPNTLYSVIAYTTPRGYSLNGSVLTDANGSYSQMILPELAGSTIFVSVDGASVTSPVAC